LLIATLAREAEHRRKNLLSNALAVVNLSQSSSPEDLKQTIVGRIRALSNVCSLFVATRWIGAELSVIATQELAAYSEMHRKRVRFDGPPLLLKPGVAQAIAMTLHELATNAAKYGALSQSNGQVYLEWSHAADGQLLLRWTETGGPAVQEPTRRGVGSRIIEGMIAPLMGKANSPAKPPALPERIEAVLRLREKKYRGIGSPWGTARAPQGDHNVTGS
jgi:two-component sensor histidine kinase